MSPEPVPNFTKPGYPPYLENLEFCHLLYQAGKYLEIALKKYPGILTQNLDNNFGF